MRLVDLIRKKRDGQELSVPEIEFIVRGYTAGELPDYQISSWLMAVLLRGMTRAETAALTQAMLHSGEVLEWNELPQKKVDKHSTGGVGDKTSLILAPIVAAGGLVVPMISGRGLGHTGGTLDKLEAIPGFNVNLSSDEMRKVLAACGASIMSKKLAEGIDALVLDVKIGSGAFMKEEAAAAHLAQLMVETGEQMGKKVVALLTDMDQPLGRAVGNATEVVECIEVLKGGGPEDLTNLTLELSAWMFYLGERTKTVEQGRNLAESLFATGAALKKFGEMVRLQGGDPRVLENTLLLPTARNKVDVKSPGAGYVSAMDAEKIGVASLVLGGGRSTKEDVIDPAVGVIVHKKVGDKVAAGEPLCTVYYNSSSQLQESCTLIEASYSVSAAPLLKKRPLIHRVIQGKGSSAA